MRLTDRVVRRALENRANAEYLVSVRLSELAQELDCSRLTVFNSIARLEKTGDVIKVRKLGAQGMVYRLCQPTTKSN